VLLEERLVQPGRDIGLAAGTEGDDVIDRFVGIGRRGDPGRKRARGHQQGY